MGRPVNLNRYRKQRARAAGKARADDNAARHGIGKPDRELARRRAEKARRDLDGHKKDP